MADLPLARLARLRDIENSDERRSILQCAASLLISDQAHFAAGSWADTALRLAQRMDNRLRHDLWQVVEQQERRLVQRMHSTPLPQESAPTAAAPTQALLTEDDLTEFVRVADLADRDNLAIPDLSLGQRMFAAAQTLHTVQGMIEHRLRARVMQRDPGLNPAWLETVLSEARAAALDFDPNLPDDWAEATAFVQEKKQTGFLTPYVLTKLWRNGEFSRFYATLSAFTDLDYITLKYIAAEPSKQGLAIACRAAGFDRAVFVMLAQLNESNEDFKITDQLYERLPQEVAQRVIRFHKLTEAA